MKAILLSKIRKRLIIDVNDSVDRTDDLGAITYKCYDKIKKEFRYLHIEQMCYLVHNISDIIDIIHERIKRKELRKFLNKIKK